MRRQGLRAALNAIPSSGSTARLQSTLSTSKRTAHGSSAWSLPQADDRLRQPQDGAAEVSKVIAESVAAVDANPRLGGVPASEPEDAGITGGTRSLMRRVMGLNVAAKPGARRPARGLAPTVQAQIA